MKGQILLRMFNCVLPLVALAACSSTEPLDPLPLEGRWIVTTVLDTFRFETGYNPPTCTAMYCGNARADTAARLSIAVTIAGDSVGGGGIRQYRIVSDTVSGIFCDQVDYSLNPGGCTHHSPVATAFYPVLSVEPPGGVIVPNGAATVVLRGASNQYVSLSGTFAGDSIVGRVNWTQFWTRGGPSHQGAFTARRQH